MDEIEIARSTAAILDRLGNWSERGNCDDPRRFSGRLNKEELQLVTLKSKTYELAMARASRRGNFESVLRETELEVAVQLARIMVGKMDPVLEGLKKVVVEEGEVCGVCQEEMESGEEGKAMECCHKFHGFCIWKWLRENNACPLCRYQMKSC